MWIFTSDEHLGGGILDGADDFHHALSASMRFHDHFAESANFVKLGDTMELWQAGFRDIFAGYMQLLRRWDNLGNRLILQPGNHDRDITLLRAFNWRIWKPIEVHEIYGWRILCLHGDRFDGWNKEGISLGKKITRIVGLLERHISPDIDNRLSRAFGRFMSRVSYIDEECAKLARSFNCDAFIHGHDHLPHEVEINGILGFDTGTWTKRFADGYPFVRVEPQRISLEYTGVL